MCIRLTHKLVNINSKREDIMKKIEWRAWHKIVLLTILLAAALFITTASSFAAQHGDFTYEVEQDGVVITKYQGSDTEVTIPEMIDGKPVVTIGDRAFLGSRENPVPNFEVNLPESITRIETNAFGYSKLTKIALPVGLEYLGVGAFVGCYELEEVIFPEGIKIKKIPARAFDIEDSKLTKIHLPASIDETEGNAFTMKTDLVVEHDTKIMKRSPVDTSPLFVLYQATKEDPMYALREDGFYYTTRIIHYSLIRSWGSGTKSTPRENIKFKYTGKERFSPQVKTVTLPENVKITPDSEKTVKVDILASEAKAGDHVTIKAIGKRSGDVVSDTGILAPARWEDQGNFAAIKSLTFDVATLRNDDYEIFASIEGKDNWIKSDNIVTVENGSTGDVKPVKKLRAKAKAADRVELSWDKNRNASGYLLYMAEADGEWKEIKRIDKNRTDKYTVKNLIPDTTYRFKAKAFLTENGETSYSEVTGGVSAKTLQINKVRDLEVNSKRNALVVDWRGDGSVDGYQIFMSASKDGEFEVIKDETDKWTTTYYKRNLTKGKRYYFQAKAYKEINGKRYFSNDTDTVSAVFR